METPNEDFFTILIDHARTQARNMVRLNLKNTLMQGISFGVSIPECSDSTNSNETWAVVKSWLGICDEEHCCDSKHPNQSTRFYPKRLLDLAGEDLPSDQVRVIETSGWPSGERYIALSHCRGNAHPLGHTKQNESKLKSGILIQQLPKSFQEAVIVGRRLEYRFLWIDCLCILQDKDGTSEWAQ